MLKKIVNLSLNKAIRMTCKIKIPFFTRIVIIDNRNWCSIEYKKVFLLCLKKRVQCILLQDKISNISFKLIKLDPKCSIEDITYKGINLWKVCKYSVLVDLQLFKIDEKMDIDNARQMIEKWFNIAACYIDYYQKIIYKFVPKKVIYLQGYILESAIARWISKEKKIDIVAIENTFTNKKIVWDFMSGITVNKNLSHNYFWRYEEMVHVERAKKYSEKYIFNIKSIKAVEHFSPKQKFKKKRGRFTIFYIGQVFTDASTLFGINEFDSPLEIISVLIRFTKINDFDLIIKLHPKEIDGFDICYKPYLSITHRKIMENQVLYKSILENKNVTYDYENVYDTYSIIEGSDLCVTINSQAGLEALLFGKPLILCGKAFYSGIGFTAEAQNRSDLQYLLKKYSQNAKQLSYKEKCTAMKFFYIINKFYFVNKSYKDFTKRIVFEEF